jgi:hypothetical protein
LRADFFDAEMQTGDAMPKSTHHANESDIASNTGSVLGFISAVLFVAILFSGYSLMSGERNPLTSETPPAAEPVPTTPSTN